MRASRSAYADVALVAAFCLFWLAVEIPLQYGSISFDEESFLWCGWSLNRGLAPYKDFFDFKPPLLFVTEAFALRLFGLADQAFRWFFSLFPLISLIAVALALVRVKVDRTIAAVLVGLVGFLVTDPSYHDSSLNDGESIGFSYYWLGVASLLVGSTRGALLAGGAFLAMAVFTKEPFVLVVVPTWLAFLLHPDVARRGQARAPVLGRRAYLQYTIAGASTVALVLLLYVGAKGGLSDYVRLFAQSRTFASTYCVKLGRFSPTTFWGDVAQDWAYLKGNLINWEKLGPLAPFLIAALARARRQLGFTLGACLAAYGGTLATTIGHCFWTHYYVFAVTGFGFLALAGAVALSRMLAVGRRGLFPWFRVGLIVLLGIQVFPRVKRNLSADYEVPPPPVPGELIDFIARNSSPDDYILTTGSPGLYVYANRRGPVRINAFLDELLVIYPGVTDEQKLRPVYEELVRKRPKIVIIGNLPMSRMQRHMRTLIRPFLNDLQYKQINDRLYLLPDRAGG